MLYAAEYNASISDPCPLGNDLNRLIHSMTKEDFDARAALQDVLKACEKTLSTLGLTSEEICRNLVMSLRKEGGSRLGTVVYIHFSPSIYFCNLTPKLEIFT